MISPGPNTPARQLPGLIETFWRMAKRSSWSSLGRRAMVERAFALLDFGGERAAQRDVELLDAAADRQQRHAVLDRLADQRQGRRIAGGIVGAVGLAGIAAIERGMDVRLRSGDHDAVDRSEQPVEVEPVAERRHQQREHAGAGDRGLEILLRRGVPDVVARTARTSVDDGDKRLERWCGLAWNRSVCSCLRRAA